MLARSFHASRAQYVRGGLESDRTPCGVPSTQQMDQVNLQHQGQEDQSIPSLQLLIVDSDGLIVCTDLSNNLRSLRGSMLGRDNRSLCPIGLQADPHMS